jgi:hypothetical protein
MDNDSLVRGRKRETVPGEAVAEMLCVLVFENGKAEGRFTKSLDALAEASRFTVAEFAAGLDIGLERDWLARDGASAVLLKAAGIHIAKKALGWVP